MGQAQAATQVGGIEFDGSKGRLAVGAAGSRVEKSPDKKVNTTGWSDERLSKLGSTDQGREIIERQVEQREALRQTTQKIEALTSKLKNTTIPAKNNS